MTQGALFVPTPEQRNQVGVLAGFGLPHHQIAVLLGCDAKTLRKYFEEELSVGNAKATAKVAQTLFNKAISGDTACLIFWMKARAGWRERSVQEHTGPNGEGAPCIRVVFGDGPAHEDRDLLVEGPNAATGSSPTLIELSPSPDDMPHTDGGQ